MLLPRLAQIAALCLLLQGCSSAQPAGLDVELRNPAAPIAASAAQLRGAFRDGTPTAEYVGEVAAVAAQLRGAFRAQEGLGERLARLMELEQQALSLLDHEPLKLGALGSAILDINYGSLSGHYMLRRFYEHVEAADTAALHGLWVAAIKTAMAQSGAGERDSPMRAVTPAEAQVYVRSEQLTPIGVLYIASPAGLGEAEQELASRGRRSGAEDGQDAAFVMLVHGRSEEGSLRYLHFGLAALYRAAEAQFRSQAPDAEFRPVRLVGELARQGDPAAQTALGAFLLNRQRLQDAIGWLQAGARSDNVIANSLLARAHLLRANRAATPQARQEALDEVLENYLHAIALGSSDAMHLLAVLYLNGVFGQDEADAGAPLLRRAAGLDNSNAMLMLAYLHYTGETVQQDLAKTERYFIRAAALNNAAARIGYARYLVQEKRRDAADERVIAWLEETVAESEDPDAMLALGNLHARGLATKQDLRAAYRWYRAAAKAAPRDAGIINEVAWTLTVSDLERLRRTRYANRIMTEVMQADQEARAQPEYLDTWAATYAARGDFAEAVRLQELALQKAIDQERDDVLPILQEHLDLFLAGKPVVEPAP